MDREKLVARLARELAEGDPLDALVRWLSPSDLHSLLLHVVRERSAQRTPAELLAQYERSSMLRSSGVDPRTLLEMERMAFEAAPDFEALELAPIAPLGTNRVLGRIDQNNCLATVRGSEVLADPTTLKALECARRRRLGDHGLIRLCSRSRLLRLQPFDSPGFWPHFDIFSLVTAGRDRGSYDFEIESLREHLSVYLRFLDRLVACGSPIAAIDVAVSDSSRNERRLERARQDVLEPLAAAFPNAVLRIDPDREHGRGYYSGLCLRIDVSTTDGRRMNLADGGFTDWTRRLLSNEKERLLVSAVGIELIARRLCPTLSRPQLPAAGGENRQPGVPGQRTP